MIVWVPRLSADVLNVALPVEPSVAVPTTVLPSRNVTVPVGIPELGELALTMAVKVTDRPKTDEPVVKVAEGLTLGGVASGLAPDRAARRLRSGSCWWSPA